MVAETRSKAGLQSPTMDVHPDRPMYRGIQAPSGPISLEADPTFNELEAAGAVVTQHKDARTVLENAFLISGEIPRTTSYEKGFPNGIRLDPQTGEWQPDAEIKDERFVMCNLADKGLVVFTGCSHAGVVNVSRAAKELGNGVPLYAVVGGFHLSDAVQEKLKSTVRDLKSLDPKVLMPGHCTGWRFAVEAEKEMEGSCVPIYAGQLYKLSSSARAS